MPQHRTTRIDHLSLAASFLQASERIASLSAQLQIPPPLLEHTSKTPKPNARKVLLGEHDPRNRHIILHVPANLTPSTLLETAYHEFGHYIDTVIFRRALGQTYWLPIINEYSQQPPLWTGNAKHTGEEDFADAVMLCLSLPTPYDTFARIGYARKAAIHTIFGHRAIFNAQHPSLTDPHGLYNFYPLLDLIKHAVYDAYSTNVH